MIDYVNVMKNTALDKLLFDFCRKRGRENLPGDTAEPVNYYLLSKYIEGKATEEEKMLVDKMIARDPSLAELLEPMEELNSNTEIYAEPVKIRSAWLPRMLRLAACLAVIITGIFWVMTTVNSSDDEMVVRGVKEITATNVTEYSTNSVHTTDINK
jgi:hypothetical protein